MNYRQANYFGNKQFIRFRRPGCSQLNFIETKSLATMKSDIYQQYQPKQLFTIQYQDQQIQKSINDSLQESKRGKLSDIINNRKKSMSPLITNKIYNVSRIVKTGQENNSAILRGQDLYEKIKNRNISLEKTHEKESKIQLKQQLISTQKRQYNNHSKSVNNIHNSPKINANVSQFECITPTRRDIKEKIKKSKLEGLINLLINIQEKQKVFAFKDIKQCAPLIEYIKELEIRKTGFQQRKFNIQLLKIR